MTRRRFLFNPDTKRYDIEVGADWRGTPATGHKSEAEIYGNLRADDGTDLSSRAKHREYMARKGLTLASDFKESWSAESIAKHRAAQARSEAADRRSDLIETYKQLTEAKRRR